MSDPIPSTPLPTGAYEVQVLGCKVNQYEAQQIRRRLDLNGMHPAVPGETSELVVVHTCAVTSMAVKKSRQVARRLQTENPGARVVVTGCAASENLLQRLDGIDAHIGPRQEWMNEFQSTVRDLGRDIQTGHAATSDHLPLNGFTAQARAFLKIQDGCDLGCTFCIVPRLRRRPRDKPIDDVVREAECLVAGGHREIVVSGVSVGLYGRDTGGPALAAVLERLLAIEGLERIRVSSLHPRELTDELLAVWASSPRMMPHLHLPLQSGSDAVLSAMQRSYSAAEFLDAVQRAKSTLEDPAINTDVIVGFPGEREKDFQETARVSRAAGFSRMHIFPFSPRPHTRAARLPDRVASAEVKERGRRLKGIADGLAMAYHSAQAGNRTMVLAEQWDPVRGTYDGYTERYVPVRFAGPPGLRGTIVPVVPGAACAGRMDAKIVDSPLDGTSS